jgi:exosortase/archaeosortase family protein
MKMVKDIDKLWCLGLRYFFLIILAIFGLPLFHHIFLPLTIHPTQFLFSIFFNSVLSGNIIEIVGFMEIEIIPACVAGSAYILLAILNLSIQNVHYRKRTLMILFSFLLLLVINILRIFFTGLVYIYQEPLFDFTHRFFWYLGSTIFIVAIWFLEVKIFGIKEIPFVKDIQFLYKKSKLKG